MRILGVIPSRYASTRFPGKPLVDIAGKPMIWRVYEQALKSKQLTRVIVATDDARISDAVTRRGGEAVMTSTRHQNGTERCVEALEKAGSSYDYVINIQGDEPYMDPGNIDDLSALLDGKTEIATLVSVIHDEQVLFNEGVAKVVLNNKQEAIYFSRQVIPFLQGIDKKDWISKYSFYKHVSLYGYRKDILPVLAKLPTGRLEMSESLEQLRWLENGYCIKAAITHYEGVTIDTPEDLQYALHRFPDSE